MLKKNGNSFHSSTIRFILFVLLTIVVLPAYALGAENANLKTLVESARKNAEINVYLQAVGICDKFLKMDLENSEVHMIQGICYTILRDYEKAIAELDKAIELDPDKAVLYLYRGKCHWRKKDKEKAIQDFTKASEADEFKTEALFRRAHLYSRKGEKEKAIADLTTIIDSGKGFAPAILIRGIENRVLDNIEMAAADFDATIEKAAGQHASVIASVFRKYSIKKVKVRKLWNNLCLSSMSNSRILPDVEMSDFTWGWIMDLFGELSEK
ncbi:tetratricopeptide repeat protein [bacterium]|nr:tetratricopeptide repeat protein [bacterium]